MINIARIINTKNLKFMGRLGVTELLIIVIIPLIGSYYLVYKMGKTKVKLEEKERQEEKNERKN